MKTGGLIIEKTMGFDKTIRKEVWVGDNKVISISTILQDGKVLYSNTESFSKEVYDRLLDRVADGKYKGI